MPRQEVEARVMRAAKMLQIDHLLSRKPRQLSGGQRQRVAIGRAITREPRIFLFDEPLSNLDAELRVQMRVELSKLHAEIGNTMIYVTHDQVEAMTMADKIVVLRGGKIEQVGTPLELYNSPASQFVAGFIGSPRMNFVSGRVERLADGVASIVVSGAATLALRTRLALSEGEAVTVGVRPEHLRAKNDGEWPVAVEVVEQLGGASYIHGRLPSGERLVIAEPGQSGLRPGASLHVSAAADAMHVFRSAPDEARGAVH
jgi:ABC-type sugar transport system ATPase subunit